MNGFAFTTVPSAVMRIGAEPVLVETTMGWTMDLDDLEARLEAFPEARVLLLSHAIGKVADMERVLEICEDRSLALVEDCSQACGVTWSGRPLGAFGVAAAYSTQSDCVINSGEARAGAESERPRRASRGSFIDCSRALRPRRASRGATTQGGFVTTDDDATAAKLIYLSGCYE